MKTNKVFIVGLVANAITACSSPPQLTEPNGDWISFDVPAKPQQTTPQSIQNRSYVFKGSLNPSSLSENDNRIIRPLSDNSSSMLPMLVKSDGRNEPLYKAVRIIVPNSMTVRLAPDVAQTFRHSVSWSGGDQWPHVLRNMLEANKLKADVNTSIGEVVIQYAQKSSVPVSVSSSKPTGLISAGNPKPVTVLKTPLIPKVTEGAKPVAEVKPAPQQKTPPVFSHPVLIKPAPVLKQWKIDKGSSLIKGFEGWVSKDKCPAMDGKWRLQKETDNDYPIDYPLSFSSADFQDATRQLFELYKNAPAPIYVTGYPNQCLIIISEKK